MCIRDSLGLSGLPLLVYARIFGFCDAGCGYFESKGGPVSYTHLIFLSFL